MSNRLFKPIKPKAIPGKIDPQYKFSSRDIIDPDPNDLTIDQALAKAKKGYFMTNQYFDNDQSLHCYDDEFYYEDGPRVTREFFDQDNDWADKGWRVKFTPAQVDLIKLKELHCKRSTFINYEEAIIKEKK